MGGGGWGKGVDASYAALTLPIAQALRAAGVEVWWQCLWTGRERPANAIGNLSVARYAGMAIAGYCSVTQFNPGWWHANHAREGVPDDLWEELRVVPCDVELENIPDATIRECVERLLELGERRGALPPYPHPPPAPPPNPPPAPASPSAFQRSPSVKPPVPPWAPVPSPSAV